jgi:selenocysteine lyase/cysteine desulfurase
MNFERARSFFPVTRELVYLDHAGVAPISTRALEALARYAEEVSRRGGFDYDSAVRAEIERVRRRAALLLGATPDEVSLVGSTSQGLRRIANGFNWRRGDRVVACELELPEHLAIFRALRARGVETRALRARDGALPLDTARRALESPRTRLLFVSSVQHGSGARTDLDTLGAACRERGVLLCVDASQSLGALPFDAAAWGVDFAVAPSHKWLLAGEGSALFYCARRVRDLIDAERAGVHAESPGALDARLLDGSENPAALFALGAAIDLILECGVEAIAARVLELARRLAEGLPRAGAELVGSRGSGATSGIVAFRNAAEPAARTIARLRARNIAVSEFGGAVRASPHFYTSEREIDAFLAALR